MSHDQHNRDRARELRREVNEAERTLWDQLRDRKRRFKFRRQHPLGPYVADFWCAAARVVVELDGASHVNREKHDRRRDEWMTERGICVLRFSNVAVDERLKEVLDEIEYVCAGRTVSPSPPAPLPAARGEGSQTYEYICSFVVGDIPYRG
jgi:very-short-patch-repair endonuclease